VNRSIPLILLLALLVGCRNEKPVTPAQSTANVKVAIVTEISCKATVPCVCEYWVKGERQSCGLMKPGEVREIISPFPFQFYPGCADSLSGSDEGCPPFGANYKEGKGFTPGNVIQQTTNGSCGANIVGAGGSVSINCGGKK
jgi:hypothetical protein